MTAIMSAVLCTIVPLAGRRYKLAERRRKLKDDAVAADYLQSAIRAMKWAEAEYAGRKERYEAIKGWREIKDYRNLSAVALYRMT